ncbi:27898_t:CDS:2, partial [Racocetra persica]
YKDKLPQKSNYLTMFRYHCAQLIDRQKKLKKYEDSTKHRDHLLMQRFHCKGWLKITIDTEKKEVFIELTHEYHAKYADIRVINEIKEYIQIIFTKLPGKDEDQIQSAIKIIEVYDYTEMILNIMDNGITMISFGLIEIIKKLGVNAVEIEENVSIEEDIESNNESNKELAEALQEYEKSDDVIDNTIVEESNEAWEEYRDTRFLLAAENAMHGIEKMLTKCEVLKNRKTLPRM